MNKYVNACEAAITEALGDAISIDELEDDLIMISDAITAARSNGEVIADSVKKVSNDLKREAERAALKAKQNAYMNKLTTIDSLATVDEGFGALGKKKDSLFIAVRALLTGANTPFKNASRSAAAAEHAKKMEYHGALLERMERLGLKHTFEKGMKGDFELQVAIAMQHYTSRNVEGSPRRLDTMNDAAYNDAMKIAKVLTDLQEKLRLDLNSSGADIPFLNGRIGSQMHDKAALIRHGMDQWISEVKENLDWDRMGIRGTTDGFIGPRIDGETVDTRRDEFLRSTWLALRTGVRKEQGAEPGMSAMFKGPSNLARSLSHSRMLHFKDAEAWLAYNKKYGGGSLRESIMQDITMSAKHVGVLRRLTTNPENFVNDMVDAIARKYRDEYPDAADYLEGKKKAIHKDLVVVTGDINIGSETTTAKVGEFLRAIKTMAVLGRAVLSSLLVDPMIAMFTRTYQGRSLAGAFSDAVSAPLMRMGHKDRTRVSRLMGVGFDGAVGAVMRRLSADDVMQGKTGAMLNTFFKLNLLAPWTDANKAGVTMMISNDLANAAGKAFADLIPEHARLLKIYGIDEKQWDVIRLASNKAEDGNVYILPGDIEEVSGSVFNGMSKVQQKKLKEKAKDNLFMLYTNEADHAVVTPGAREQAIMTQGLTPDTGLGQAIRMMTQFKAFPITIISKTGGRMVHGQGSNVNSAALIAGLWATGIATVQLKEMSQGREPLELGPDLVKRGFIQGGAAGIWGDLLLHNHSEYGGSLFQTVAGPVPNDLWQGFESFVQKPLFQGDTSDMGETAVRLLKGNTPGSNLFYTKMAMDYLVWHQLQELVNPGYVQRMERNLENRTGQKYYDWASPTKRKNQVSKMYGAMSP